MYEIFVLTLGREKANEKARKDDSREQSPGAPKSFQPITEREKLLERMEWLNACI